MVYESDWEIQTTAIQKELQLVLVRAQAPVGITAGKFCYMNMEQFGIVSQFVESLCVKFKSLMTYIPIFQILKTTYSFFEIGRAHV